MSEPDARIRALILDYLAYGDHDGDDVRSVFALADAPTVAAILLEMLRSGEQTVVNNADFFLLDAVKFGEFPEFTAHLPHSGIFDALRDLLYIANSNLRHNAIHTIGRMGPRENGRFLLEALPTYLERYPLELPDLLAVLFEFSPAHLRRRWEYYERVATAPNYLVRWSLLQIIDYQDGSHRRRSAAAQRAEDYLVRLSADEHPLVRADAAHRLACLQFGWERAGLTSDERTLRERQLRKAEPPLPFYHLELVFANHLTSSGRGDYDLALLDDFAQYRLLHLEDPPIDQREDARAFEAWRAKERPANTLS